MRIPHRMFAAVLLSSLAGCATQATRAPAAPVSRAAAELTQAERSTWWEQKQYWALEGRVAVRKAGKGGSGRIDWSAQGDGYEIALSAPVTRQSWRLIGHAAGGPARLEGLEGGAREGEDAEAMLLESTGWEIPVQALAFWVRGLVAPDTPVEAVEYARDGRLAALRQAGWEIGFTGWREGEAGGPALPERIDATRGDAKVRLLIDHWTFATP